MLVQPVCCRLNLYRAVAGRPATFLNSFGWKRCQRSGLWKRAVLFELLKDPMRAQYFQLINKLCIKCGQQDQFGVAGYIFCAEKRFHRNTCLLQPLSVFFFTYFTICKSLGVWYQDYWLSEYQGWAEIWETLCWITSRLLQREAWRAGNDVLLPIKFRSVWLKGTAVLWMSCQSSGRNSSCVNYRVVLTWDSDWEKVLKTHIHIFRA